MSTPLDSARTRYEESQRDLNDFLSEHEDVIEELRELANKRNKELKDYVKLAKGAAKADSKKRGIVEVGLFNFQKKLKRVIEPEDLLKHCPDSVEHGVFMATNTLPVTDRARLEEIMEGEDGVDLKVNRDRVDDLVNQGVLDKVEVTKATTESPMTPAFSSGPKEIPIL